MEAQLLYWQGRGVAGIIVSAASATSQEAWYVQYLLSCLEKSILS